MDNFQYALRIKEIDTFKTLKAKEEFIREMEKLLTNGSWSNIAIEPDPQSYQNIFKCITKCNAVYTRALPEFITRSITSGHTALMTYYMKEAVNVSYETITDTFQYVEEVQMPNTHMAQLKRLSIIYSDSPLTFAFKHNIILDSSFSSMFALIKGTPSKVPHIFQAEEIKRSLPATTRYTIIESVLQKLYSATIVPSEFAGKATTLVNNLVTTAAIFKAKVDG